MVLIESLISGKKSLGAEFRFEPDTLEVKQNKNGIKGVFTRRAIPEGAEIIATAKLNGSLTPFRAYEEAQEVLQRLGDNRFNIDDKFALACAMCLRFTNPDTKHSDLLVTDPDWRTAYHGSVMSSYGSLALAKLLDPNNHVSHDEAAKAEDLVLKTKLDPSLLRAMLAYVHSRMWERLGLIPVLDRFNASYGNGANCHFMRKNGFLTYFAIRDIQEGEELVWNYNGNNAVGTWFNYGYVDAERPTIARLLFRVTDRERLAFENFAVNVLNLTKQDVTPKTKIDVLRFDFNLQNPGKLSTPALMRIALSQCEKGFLDVRSWFRVYVLMQNAQDLSSITPSKLESDDPFVSLDFEKDVISRMRDALKQGLAELRTGVDIFSQSEVGKPIDMSPYIRMTEEASAAWDDALAALEELCSIHDIADLVPFLNSTLHLSINSASEIKAALEKNDEVNPTLKANMIRRYVLARL